MRSSGPRAKYTAIAHVEDQVHQGLMTRNSADVPVIYHDHRMLAPTLLAAQLLSVLCQMAVHRSVNQEGQGHVDSVIRGETGRWQRCATAPECA